MLCNLYGVEIIFAFMNVFLMTYEESLGLYARYLNVLRDSSIQSCILSNQQNSFIPLQLGNFMTDLFIDSYDVSPDKNICKSCFRAVPSVS